MIGGAHQGVIAAGTPRASGGWTPSDLGAQLVAWYDSADAATFSLRTASGTVYVTGWQDKSGNGHHLTQPNNSWQALYEADGSNFGGVPVLKLSGSGGLYSGWNSGLPCADGQSVSFALAIRQYGSVGAGFASVLGIGYQSVAGTARRYARRYALSPCYSVDGIGVAQSTRGQDNAAHIPIVTHDGSTDQVAFFANGSACGTGSRTMATPASNPRIKIGGEPWNDYAGGADYIPEIIITASVLTTDDRQLVEGYLAHKWGMAGSLPVDHPYKTTAP